MMIRMYLYIKAMHIVSVISWFAGLIYLGRLFIYYKQADGTPDEKRVLQKAYAQILQRLQRYIVIPASIFVIGTGAYMLGLSPIYTQPWFHAKAALLLCVFVYQYYAGSIYKRLVAEGEIALSLTQLRIFNELLTILMVMIVFTAVSKKVLGMGIGLGVILAIVLVILLLQRLWKMTRGRG